MQRRFHISYHEKFEDALAAKKKLSDEQTNKFFQIRKRKNNFDLVGRVTTTEAMKSPDNNPQMYAKKKKPKKIWKKSDNAPKFEMNYNNQTARDNGTGKWTGRTNPYKAHNEN